MSPLSLHLEASGLQIEWPDARHTLPAAQLRSNCRCAECQRLVLTGTPQAPADALQLVGATPIGQYAIQLHFSDGHQRGIYPWPHLRQIGGHG